MDKPHLTDLDRAIWIQACLASLESGKMSDVAIAAADRIVGAFKQRFDSEEDKEVNPCEKSVEACVRALSMMAKLDLFKLIQNRSPEDLDRFIHGMAADFSRTLKTSPITRGKPKLQAIMGGFYNGPEFPKLIKNFVRTGDVETLTADIGKALLPYIKSVT